MSREMCYRCFWPKRLCWCSSISPIKTRTKIIILMHPKEYKQVKAATGRFAHLCLANSEIHTDVSFDANKPVQALINDPRYFPVLLYPCANALNLSDKGFSPDFCAGRQLLVFMLDATWILAKRMFNRSPSLQKLPRLMFVPQEKSRYKIKKQPHDWCLSTIEAAHELMLALEKAGLDNYERPTQMLALFDKMQQYQISCMQDPSKQSYRQSQKLKSPVAVV
ncbi:MAG: DTW domain-containing protein [Chitinivibrionales bacterium]|nr:DTW domain-containing protein [Chitinivibrionales bacterium]